MAGLASGEPKRVWGLVQEGMPAESFATRGGAPLSRVLTRPPWRKRLVRRSRVLAGSCAGRPDDFCRKARRRAACMHMREGTYCALRQLPL